VYLPGKKNPFKCPFCPKKYRMERHMLAHQRKDHLTDKEPSRNDISNQEALIRRSHISMARKASQAISEEITRVHDASENDLELSCGRRAYGVPVHTVAVDSHSDIHYHNHASNRPLRRHQGIQAQAENTAIRNILSVYRIQKSQDSPTF